MTEPTMPVRKLQWKWVGITIGFYVLFYVLPILIASGAFSRNAPGRLAYIFLAIWCFAGMIINAAVVGYLSEGVTIWEPVVGAAFLATLALAVEAFRILGSPAGDRPSMFLHIIAPILFLIAISFILSLIGAWLGERAQKLWKKKPPEAG